MIYEVLAEFYHCGIEVIFRVFWSNHMNNDYNA